MPYGSEHRYQVYDAAAPANWADPSFDDSAFPLGTAPFGDSLFGGVCPIYAAAPPRTSWPLSTQLLLRRTFTLPAAASGVKIGLAVDNDVKVAVNGVELTTDWILSERCAARDQHVLSVPAAVVGPGTNLLAVLGRDRGGESYLDAQVTMSGPTAVSVRSLGACRQANGILIRWRTAAETEILGFNTYRQQQGMLMKLNRALIPSVFGGTTNGHAYSWLDRSAPRGAARYRLQALSLSGKRSWVGSAAAG